MLLLLLLLLLLSLMILAGFTCPVTIHFKFITKCDSLFYYKMRWSVSSIGYGGMRTFSIFWVCVLDTDSLSSTYLCYFQAPWLEFWILMIFAKFSVFLEFDLGVHQSVQLLVLCSTSS